MKSQIIVRVHPRTFLKKYHSLYGNFSGRGFDPRRIFWTILLFLAFPFPAYAAGPCPTPPYPNGVPLTDCFGFGGIKSLGEGTNFLVIPTFSIATAAVVIYFLLGAFKYLSSGGDKERVAEARGMITHAIIGFIILMFAFLILQFLLSSLFKITDFQIIKT